MKTFVSSSAKMQEFENGDLVHDIGYSANYDGTMADIEVKHGDQEYYTQLDNDALLDLLDVSDSKEDLMERLRSLYHDKEDFTDHPPTLTSSKSKSRSARKSYKKKTNKNKSKSKKKK